MGDAGITAGGMTAKEVAEFQFQPVEKRALGPNMVPVFCRQSIHIPQKPDRSKGLSGFCFGGCCRCRNGFNEPFSAHYREFNAPPRYRNGFIESLRGKSRDSMLPGEVPLQFIVQFPAEPQLLSLSARMQCGTMR